MINRHFLLMKLSRSSCTGIDYFSELLRTELSSLSTVEAFTGKIRTSRKLLSHASTLKVEISLRTKTGNPTWLELRIS